MLGQLLGGAPQALARRHAMGVGRRRSNGGPRLAQVRPWPACDDGIGARTRSRTNRTSVLARPTGVGRAIATYDMPIEGRDEWLAAARRLA
jgi:hypothetical protein